MYCNQCGELVPRGSRFCNYCGYQVLEAPAPGQVDRGPRGEKLERPPARLRGDEAQAYGAAGQKMLEEQEIFTLRPTMIFVWLWYFLAAVIWLAVAALMGLIFQLFTTTGILVLLIVGLALFSLPVYKHILRSREIYTLTNHHLQMRFGLIAKTVRNIPVTKIQDVTVTASVWQRVLNLGDIEIDSASEGGKITLDDIHYPDRYANMILAEARRRN